MAATFLNQESSRSHTILFITVSKRELQSHKKLGRKTAGGGGGGGAVAVAVAVATGATKVSQLALVDLAGSENISKSGAKFQRLEEAKSINKSLLALGNVIQALSSQPKVVADEVSLELAAILLA